VGLGFLGQARSINSHSSTASVLAQGSEPTGSLTLLTTILKTLPQTALHVQHPMLYAQPVLRKTQMAAEVPKLMHRGIHLPPGTAAASGGVPPPAGAAASAGGGGG
jgi:hypothetical protein